MLFDRDETLIEDIPYNGDPARVVPLPGAREALDALRAAGIPVAVVSNQSGVGRGLITLVEVDAVNARVGELLGPFLGFFVCPHGPEDGCDCRKPRPKLILDAACALSVDPACCVVIGDKESDVQAARNAGATGVRVDASHTVREAVAEILKSL
ncbi:MAG: HAD family hydrolase [Candidatus Eremiobacteraeota bacterium]|nr:HAD family hydrolase [Candidatus Eremiobacteraeota bacterium]